MVTVVALADTTTSTATATLAERWRLLAAEKAVNARKETTLSFHSISHVYHSTLLFLLSLLFIYAPSTFSNPLTPHATLHVCPLERFPKWHLQVVPQPIEPLSTGLEGRGRALGGGGGLASSLICSLDVHPCSHEHALLSGCLRRQCPPGMVRHCNSPWLCTVWRVGRGHYPTLSLEFGCSASCGCGAGSYCARGDTGAGLPGHHRTGPSRGRGGHAG